MGTEDIIDTLKDGVGLAGRMAARGVGEVSKAFKPSKDARGQSGDTGLYYVRHLHPIFGSMVPVIQYEEVQQPRKLIMSYLKNLTVPAAERSFLAGCQMVLRGQLSDAREKMIESFTKDAQFADAYFMHAAICVEMNEWGEAVHSLKKVLLCQAKLSGKLRKYIPSVRLTLCLTENSSFAIYPDMLGVSLLLSIAHRGNGDDDETPNVLEQVLGVMPDHPVVCFFLALHYIEADRWHDAVSLLKDTLPDENISLANLILLGKSCMHTGDADTAVEIFRKILTRTDFDPQLMVDVRYNLGTALALQGRSGEAEDEFNRITAQYPGYMDILERLGVEPGRRKKAFIALPAGRAALTAGSNPPAAATAVSPAAAAASSSSAALAGSPPASTPAGDATRGADSASSATGRAASQESEVKSSGSKTSDFGTTAAPPAPPTELKVGGEVALVSPDGKVNYILSTPTVVIGREEGDIVLNWDTSASRVHARVLKSADGLWVEDIGSTNGTYVNGHRIRERVQINRGDMLTVGQTQLRLQ